MIPGIIASQTAVTVVPSGALLLDTYPTGVFTAHSAARKLRAAYSGACMRVRRSSDSTEQDIGFDGSNNLDETALLAFVGSGDGFVTKLYDQTSSPTNKNLVQTTQSRQPKIAVAGVVQRIGSAPAMLFSGSQGLYSEGSPSSGGTSATILAVFRTTGTNLSVIYETGSSSGGSFTSPRAGILLDVNEFGTGAVAFVASDSVSSAGGYFSNNSSLPKNYVVKGAVVAGAADRNSTYPVFAINGVSAKDFGTASATLSTITYGANQFNIGSRSAATGSLQLNGLIGEVIRYVGTSYITDGTLDANLIAKFS